MNCVWFVVIVFHLFLVFVIPEPFGSLRNRAAELELKNDGIWEGDFARDYRGSDSARTVFFFWNSRIGVEKVKKKSEVKAVAIEGTPSMMDDVNDDAPMGHVSKHMRWALMEMEPRFAVRTELMTMPSLRRKTHVGRPGIKWQLVTKSQSKRVVDDQSDKLLCESDEALLCESGERTLRDSRSSKEGRLQESETEGWLASNGKEGFKNEQHAGQQVQSGISAGIQERRKCKKAVSK